MTLPGGGYSRDQALAELRDIAINSRGIEHDHIDADEVLLKLIDDDEIRAAFDAIEKWYA